MPQSEVFEAMQDASKAFIYIPQLQQWAGARLAKAFGAEAGLPTAGAVNGLMLACAACIMKGSELEEYDPLGKVMWTSFAQRLPMRSEGLPTEFVVLGDSRSEYDHAIEATGGKPVTAGNTEVVSISDLEAAYHPGKTAAYYYTMYPWTDQVPLKEFVKVAHSHGCPVIVDAAPYLTHRCVPSTILESGCDLLIFSGGKQFGAPNNSGILLGRKNLIKLAHLQAYPFDGIGRASKMSRETIVGLIAALDLFMKRDDNTYYTKMREETEKFSMDLNSIPGIKSGVLVDHSVCENVVESCYAWVELSSDKLTLRQLSDALFNGDPSIRTLYEPTFISDEVKNRITLKTEYLLPGDKEIILRRIKEILR